MPWSGGTFTRTDGTRTGSTVWQDAKTASVKIVASDHDTHDQDFADGINSCLHLGGQNSPTANIDWGGFAISNLSGLTVQSDDAGATVGPTLILWRNSASPAASDGIGALRFDGEEGTSGDTVSYARIYAEIVDPSDGSTDGGIVFQTAVAGTVTAAFTLRQGLFAATATGGDQGAGTINAETVYDDGVDVTCYVVEAWLDGRVDVPKWHGLANKGAHARAEGFAAVAADRLDLDKYVGWIRTNRRLPAFPGPQVWVDDLKGKIGHGDLMQRLWETVELQAVHIATLHERLKTVEGMP